MALPSKGCGTCKRRKVKCDEARPTCTRCRNAGIECTGFVKRLRFVDEKPRIQRSAAVSYVQSHEFSITRSSHLVFHSSRMRQSQSASPAHFLAKSLPLTAFKDDVFMSYLVSKFFEEGRHCPLFTPGESPCGLPIEWTSELITTPQKPRHRSWDALAAIVFGQAHGNFDIITNALRLYGQALAELYSQLLDLDHRYSASTLASITALYLYQIIVSKTEKGWMLHADGLGGILQWRGPQLQKAYATKNIFLEHRITLVAKAIISGETTFLQNPVWKNVPWEDDPASKSAIDYLVDIGADIAEYLAIIKIYNNSKINQQLAFTQLRAQVAASLEELNTWWYQWEANHPQAATEVPSYQSTSEPLFPTLLEYDILRSAYTVCTHNTMRILLLQIWQMLQPFHDSLASANPEVILDVPNRTALLGITSDIQGLACEILRSLKFCYGKSRRFTITFAFLFIQEVTYGCFDKESEEAKWVAAQGWAELVNSDDIEDANLLKRLLPLGKIKFRDVNQKSVEPLSFYMIKH